MSTDQKQISVSVDVDASPEVVWSLLSDLARMGEWSPECTGVTWAGAAPGPAGPSVGAVFKGKNKIGIRRWSTKGTIVAAEPNRRISWDIAALGLPVARWSYAIEPADRGCQVTETWEDKRGGIVNALGPLTTGVKDRVAHNQAGMRTTLDRLKAAAEARAASA
ncbi:MAG TPA: SRPBCC family protein [Acidimicrobiia bacterium]|nr:SRPBCC family protein [Acidimicrobiia bacterium]